MKPELKYQGIVPPEGIPECLRRPEVVGVFVGGCVKRGVGSSFRARAHAHTNGKHQGWICIRGWRRLYQRGLMLHELAHILTRQGHTDKWRACLRELGGRVDAHYQKRSRTQKGDIRTIGPQDIRDHTDGLTPRSYAVARNRRGVVMALGLPADNRRRLLTRAEILQLPSGSALLCGHELVRWGRSSRQTGHSRESRRSPATKRNAGSLRQGESVINGLKLIYQTGRVDIPDDPSYPLRLDLNFRVPELMTLAFIGRYGGSEEVVVRAKSMESVVQFLAQNEFLSHSRIRWVTVTGPDGLRENLELGSPPRCVRMDEMEVYSNGKQVKARTLDGRVQSMSDALVEKAAKALEMEAGVKP